MHLQCNPYNQGLGNIAERLWKDFEGQRTKNSTERQSLKKEENTKGRRVNLGGVVGRLSGCKYNQIGCVKLSKIKFDIIFLKEGIGEMSQ